MGISVRTMLTAGVCGVTAGAIVLAPSAAQPRASFAPAFSYTAYSLGSADPHTKITPETMRDAVDFIESIGPSPTGGSSSTTAPAITGFTAPPIAAVDDDGQVEVQNVASDVIDSVYSFTKYWANYVALDLGPWLINWVPFGYLVSDQINIWYNAFVLPVVDSFVYKFLDPIVNDPLNLGVWWNGAVAIADAAIKGVGAGIAGEINYVFSLGWLPFPLPPLPGLAPQAATDTADPVLRMSLAAASGEVTSTPSTESSAAPEAPSATPDPTEAAPADPQTEDPEAGLTDGTPDPTATPTPTPEPTAPTPDNSGPTTPTPTPTPSTDPTEDPGTPDDDGTVIDNPGTEDPSSGTDTDTDTDTGTDTDTDTGTGTDDGGTTGEDPSDGGSSDTPGTDTPHSADPGTTADTPNTGAGSADSGDAGTGGN